MTTVREQEQCRYALDIVQHPLRARMCGFGDKDRRPIDPPPVVKLVVHDHLGNIVHLNEVSASRFVLHTGLCSANLTEDRNTVINPSSIPTPISVYNHASVVMSLNEPVKARNLVGVTVSSAYHLRDENNELGIFFIFHELSVRTEGRFRLKFMLFELSMNEAEATPVLAEGYSDVFEVYSAKNFPGMTESTELSKALASQGIKISIRKSIRVRNRPGNHHHSALYSGGGGGPNSKHQSDDEYEDNVDDDSHQ
ncbi:hypothetical protein H4219_001683 [Mycoemilia scoparia]|uniref:Velvet domain-containing protein n=1 Tax=Mycoemilia scoparia TaxID=417184 RepID=A0A9W7ZZH1_9FUNG|nr:hypothetical protein H4219_001683 [Mycoemilia scoparia]